MINAKTKLCCIIGNPVEHSLSPQLHNAAYESLGLNYVFLAFRVSDVKSALLGFKELGVRGISVTVPYKLEVMKYLDKLDDVARQIGAVNTIINDNGKLIGTNTDWIGALKALEEKTVIKGKRVVILGAGGAARAIVYGLKTRHAIIHVLNRTKKTAELLVKKFGLEKAYSLSDATIIEKADIIINATSIGMTPQDWDSPIPAKFVKKNQVVFDIVYTPNETKLLQYAKKKKAVIVYGHKMLLYGVAKQFELFTGKKAPIELMEKALLEIQ